MTLVKMTNKSFNPIQIHRLGTNAVVQDANPVPHLIQRKRDAEPGSTDVLFSE